MPMSSFLDWRLVFFKPYVKTWLRIGFSGSNFFFFYAFFFSVSSSNIRVVAGDPWHSGAVS